MCHLHPHPLSSCRGLGVALRHAKGARTLLAPFFLSSSGLQSLKGPACCTCGQHQWIPDDTASFHVTTVSAKFPIPVLIASAAVPSQALNTAGLILLYFSLTACSKLSQAAGARTSLMQGSAAKRDKAKALHNARRRSPCSVNFRKGENKQRSARQHPLLGNHLTRVIKQLSGSEQPDAEFNQQPEDERLYSGHPSQLTNPLRNIFWR